MSFGKEGSGPGDAQRHSPRASVMCQALLSASPVHHTIESSWQTCLIGGCLRCYTDKKSRAQRGQVICPRVPSYQRGGSRSGPLDLELRSRASCITCIVGPGPVASALPSSLLGNAPAQLSQARVHTAPRFPGGPCARASSRNPGPTTMPRVPLRLPPPDTHLPPRPALMASHSLLWSRSPDLSRGKW